MSTLVSDAQYLDPGATACQELLGRVVNSRELSRAQRLRELLCLLGERSLKPQAAALREQEIGAVLFGRPPDYDTSLDNIVRVNVSELRKRLAHYFAEEGVHEPIVMEIPRGGYAPVFYLRKAAAEVPAVGPAGAPVAEAAGAPPRPEAEAKPGAATALESEGAAKVEAAAAASRGGLRGSRPGLDLALAVGLILALAGCAALAWQNHRLRTQMEPWRVEPVRAALWSEFFASGDDVDIVTADTSFALAQDLLGRTISLNDYLDYNYRSFAEDPALSPDRRAALKLVLDRNNGSIGDFQAAKRFMDLDAHSPALRLAGARSYTPESIKTHNVILIGSRESNPWVDLYRSRMNFFLDYDPASRRTRVVNSHPQAGEKVEYDASLDQDQGYSVAAFLPNLSEGRYSLIVSGSDSQATRAAGEFLVSSQGLAQLRQKAPSGRFPYFEVVLGSSRLVGTTLTTEILAYRVYPR